MKKKIITAMMLSGSLVLTACGGGGSGDTPEIGQALENQQQDVDFDFDFSALLDKEINPAIQDDFSILADDQALMTGSMLVENLDSTEIENHSWIINLDENDLTNVTSLKTLVLEPANYSFSLVLDRGDQQYVGSAVHTVVDGGQDLVPMMIRPVIGDSQVNTSIVSELVDFRFNYSESQIAEAGLVSPSIGITVDAGVEQIFELDPVNGLSEHMFLNLLPGAYDMSLRLFDGGNQVGKSVEAQGFGISVSPGTNVSLDIVPLFGELGLALAVEGGDAVVTVQVPAEVVSEAGDLSNLQTILSVVGQENPFRELELALQQNGPDYTATVVLSDMYYGNVDFELAFNDIVEDEPLGACVDSTTISRNVSTVDCRVDLRRRSVIGGDILSTLGLNVFDTNGVPVSGAIVSVDGEDVAITNSAAFSAPGYSKLFLKPGARDIRARAGTSFGDLSYASVPLSVANRDLTLDQVDSPATLLQDSFDGTQSGAVSPMGYWFGCLAKGPVQGFIGGNSLFLGSRYNNTRSDWCWNTNALTLHSFTDAEITNAGGFMISADIISGAAVNSRASISIGGEIGSDPLNFHPEGTLDVVVHVIDAEVQVLAYESGALVDNIQVNTGLPFSSVNNVKLFVNTSSFAAGAPATVDVLINDDPSFNIPTVGFDWDGGNNHIGLRGGGGVGANGGGISYIEYGALEVSPLN